MNSARKYSLLLYFSNKQTKQNKCTGLNIFKNIKLTICIISAHGLYAPAHLTLFLNTNGQLGIITFFLVQTSKLSNKQFVIRAHWPGCFFEKNKRTCSLIRESRVQLVKKGQNLSLFFLFLILLRSRRIWLRNHEKIECHTHSVLDWMIWIQFITKTKDYLSIGVQISKNLKFSNIGSFLLISINRFLKNLRSGVGILAFNESNGQVKL